MRSFKLNYLLQDILTIETQDDQNLQTALDILGELVKFNKRNILLLEAQIRPSDMQKFLNKCLSHLIDSNVFLRSILLAMLKCQASEPSQEGLFNADKGFIKNSKICSFVSTKIPEIINDIQSNLTVERISQTILSCLNTVIITIKFISSCCPKNRKVGHGKINSRISRDKIKLHLSTQKLGVLLLQ
ncbi:unnamed protein product [Moneuplotes crassus]|uniref:Uncharacterized protein n=1 Tax=Euplotes crassus TaxID=5936 RepID=A0AAD1Y3X0_EUPCR|nr:unnamed protein product [Moneuplotes crassus]